VGCNGRRRRRSSSSSVDSTELQKLKTKKRMEVSEQRYKCDMVLLLTPKIYKKNIH
jgi:hypothetical protein